MEEVNISLNKKHFTSKIYQNLIRDDVKTSTNNTYSHDPCSPRMNKNNNLHQSNPDKNFFPSEFEPVFEEDEKQENTDHQKKSASRLKIIKDSKEDSFSKENKNLIYRTYDKIFDSIIEEDHNEILFEKELKPSKSYKKIETFTDKLDHIEEINDLVFDHFNIESIKEEMNEEEEFNKNKMNISGYLQFADESEKLNCYKILSRVNLDGEDIILENENDEEKINENDEDKFFDNQNESDDDSDYDNNYIVNENENEN